MTTTPSPYARLMTTAEVAELLGVEKRTIERWRKGGDGPPYLMIGGTIRYHPARVQAWLASCEQGTPTSTRGTPSTGKGGTPAGRRGTRAR